MQKTGERMEARWINDCCGYLPARRPRAFGEPKNLDICEDRLWVSWSRSCSAARIQAIPQPLSDRQVR